MRSLKFDDVKHLQGQDYGSNVDFLTKLVQVVSTFYDEAKIKSPESKKRKSPSTSSEFVPEAEPDEICTQKKNPSWSPDSVLNSRDEFLRKEKLLKKPMEEKVPSCRSLGLKLKFKFGGIDQELPTCSGSNSLKIQEKPTCSGSNGLEIQELPTSSGSQSFENQEWLPSFGSKRLKIQELPKICASKSFENKELLTSFGSQSLMIQEMPISFGSKKLKNQETASSSSARKRRKVGDHHCPPPELPQYLKDFILELARGREVSEPILVVQKELFVSDILSGQNRFMIPRKQMNPFLSTDELASLPLQEVVIVEPNLNIGTITLAKWKMSSDVLVLRGNWSKVIARNSLDVGMIMQLWAVRIDNELLLVLVRVPAAIPEDCTNGDCQASEKNVDMED